MIHQPIRRLTIYNVAGTSPLVPASGSVHSDPFQVTSVSGSAGWTPYLNMVNVEKGSIKLPEVKYSTGRCVCKLSDFKTGTSNAERWVTAFIGDSEGRNRLSGRKAFVQESTDNGATWDNLFFGRVSNVALDNPLQMVFTFEEEVIYLQNDILEFTPTGSVPDVDFHRLTLVPFGMEGGFIKRNIPASIPVDGVIEKLEHEDTTIKLRLNERANVTRRQQIEEIEHTVGVDGGRVDITGHTNTDKFHSELNICYVYNSSGTKLGAGSVYDFHAIGDDDNQSTLFILQQPQLKDNGLNNPDYFDFSTLSAGDSIKVMVVATSTTDGLNTTYMSAVSSIDVLGAVLSGSLGPFTSTVDYDSTNFDTIKTSLHNYPPFLMSLRGSMNAQEFIEKTLLQPYMLGYTMVPASGSSTFRVFSTEIPSSSDGISTITGSDLVTTDFAHWSTDKPNIFISRVEEDFFDFSRIRTSNIGGGLGGQGQGGQGRRRVIANKYTLLTTRQLFASASDPSASIDEVQTTIEIECEGMRGLQAIDVQDFTYPSYNKGYETVVNNYADRFSVNKSNISLTCRRTATVDALGLGDWVILDLEQLPDPNTRQRGGTRLVQVIGKNESGITTSLQVIDGGLTTTLSAPSMSISAVNTVNAQLTVTATVDAFHKVEYVLLPEGTTSVSTTDLRWTFGVSLDISSGSSSTYTINNVPLGTRVYGRARAQRPLTGPLQLPSQWTYTSALDLVSVDPPTNLSVSGSTYYSTTTSWTVANSTYSTEVWSTGTESGISDRFSTEIAGTDRILLTGLNNSPTTGIVVKVRHLDDNGGFSSFASASFNRGAGTNSAPSMSGIFTYVPSLFG